MRAHTYTHMYIGGHMCGKVCTRLLGYDVCHCDVDLSGLGLAHQLYMSVMALGFDAKGIQALQLALDNLNNVRTMSSSAGGTTTSSAQIPKHLI